MKSFEGTTVSSLESGLQLIVQARLLDRIAITNHENGTIVSPGGSRNDRDRDTRHEIRVQIAPAISSQCPGTGCTRMHS